MSEKPVSRRSLMAVVGVGAAAIADVTTRSDDGHALADEPSELASSRTRRAARGDAESIAACLLAPLGPGTRLGRWRVERIVSLSDGAVSVVLGDAAGRSFQLDVCAKDEAIGAVRGPGTSAHFDVFLANGGDGVTVTDEDHGLAAMALADVIRGNEASVPRTAFTTLAARLARQSARVHVG